MSEPDSKSTAQSSRHRGTHAVGRRDETSIGAPHAEREGYFLRFSLRALLVGMAVIAVLIPVAGYTLRHASTWVGSLVFLITAMLHATAACMAFNRTGASRAWWTGCAIFGITYFVVGGDPWSQPYNYELFTETIATAAYNHFYPEGSATANPSERVPVLKPVLPPDDEVQPEGVTVVEDFSAAMNVTAGPDVRDFVMVAHMYWSLLFAFMGGWISLFMYWTGQRRASVA